MPLSPADRFEITVLLPLLRVVQRHVPTDPPMPVPVAEPPTDAEIEAILAWIARMKRRGAPMGDT